MITTYFTITTTQSTPLTYLLTTWMRKTSPWQIQPPTYLHSPLTEKLRWLVVKIPTGNIFNQMLPSWITQEMWWTGKTHWNTIHGCSCAKGFFSCVSDLESLCRFQTATDGLLAACLRLSLGLGDWGTDSGLWPLSHFHGRFRKEVKLRTKVKLREEQSKSHCYCGVARSRG